uniref:Uncharacterized protein AlNc14C2G296 n=1 Tax=Albugo laibachii Nc14 TaxID=890382 RepID=F0VZF8_9STRA|nr:conserved hypothetical protein [Albugo laibachii Nc14]|eukprot:CCA14188.1 conserved hypothetical protein [Albugo laibachii Nc14]
MDRTCEFVNICVLFDTGCKPQQIHKPLSNASRWSEQIADQQRQNEQLLIEFEQLVSTKNFSGGTTTTQIATLIDILKKDLKSIDDNIQQFQKNMEQSGKHPQHYQAHFSVVASLLKTRCAKSAKRFHAALQRHTEMIKAQSTRRSRFSHAGASPVVRINTPLFARPNATKSAASSVGDATKKHLGQIIPTAGNAQNANTTSPSTEPLKTGLRRRGQVEQSEPSSFSEKPFSGSSAKQSMQIYTRRGDSQTRYQNASQVESTIVEISGMYSRMANMVAEQGEILTRIDDNMDAAQQNVESAQGELLKLYHMVSGNRSLIIKIFIILILVIILFVVVF